MRHSSVQAAHCLSLSPNACIDACSAAEGAGAGCGAGVDWADAAALVASRTATVAAGSQALVRTLVMTATLYVTAGIHSIGIVARVWQTASARRAHSRLPTAR